MIKQIVIDENGIIICSSIGAYIEGGIDVDDIPDEVFTCPQKWKYSEGKYIENLDYAPNMESLNEAKIRKITESKVILADWLAEHPMFYTDGKLYSVTEEKQSLLNSNLASYERATKAGISYPLKWNSTGDECVLWEYKELVTLSLSIAAYVAPKVSKQQELELAIKACKTVDELETVVISYD